MHSKHSLTILMQGDASKRCYRRCLSGHHSECLDDEKVREKDHTSAAPCFQFSIDANWAELWCGIMILKSKCFAQAGCKNGVLEQEPDEDAEEEIDESTKSPDYTPSPTPIPRDTDQPTYSPLEKDDYKNYFFCGKTWVRRLLIPTGVACQCVYFLIRVFLFQADATKRCHKRCLSGMHSDCPSDEEVRGSHIHCCRIMPRGISFHNCLLSRRGQCFTQIDCKNGVIEQDPTEVPTLAVRMGVVYCVYGMCS